MSKAKKPEEQPWLKFIVLPLLLIIFGLEISYAYLSRVKTSTLTPRETQELSRRVTPTPTPTQPKYTCPKTDWIDCMPNPGSPKAQCTDDFLKWAKANCPKFQGVAY